MTQFWLGLLAGIGIAYVAYRSQALNQSGGLAAGLLGTVVFGLGGVGWAAVLLTFFISSSFLSKLFKQRKAQVGQNFAKGSRRDAGQVAANGAFSGLMALFYFFTAQTGFGQGWQPVLWVGFAASLAAANADTWATELGVLNPRRPILLKDLRRVPQGTSGAVSLVGSLAALAGAGLVAGMAVLSNLAGWTPAGIRSPGTQFLAIVVAGVLGSFIDSFLGATIQAVYYCPNCQKETERYPIHICGTKTKLKRGLPWLNNDWVNTACTFSAGLIGLLLAGLF